MNKSNLAIIYARSLGLVCTDDGVVIESDGRKRRVFLAKSKPNGVYFAFKVKTFGHCRNVLVHRFAAHQKFGDSLFEKGIMVRHLDGNPMNNRLSNIAIGTNSDNQRDIHPQLRSIRNGKLGLKMSSETVDAIRQLHANGDSYKSISIRTGFSKSLLSYYLSPSAKKRSFLFPISESRNWRGSPSPEVGGQNTTNRDCLNNS